MISAHGGGVPETLSIVIPLVAVVILLRSGRKHRDAGDPPPDTPDGGGDHDKPSPG